jgi:hypothetical protein
MCSSQHLSVPSEHQPLDPPSPLRGLRAVPEGKWRQWRLLRREGRESYARMARDRSRSALNTLHIPHLSPRLLTALYSPHCPRAGRDRERTVCGDRVGWRVSRPPCRSSGRPDAISKGWSRAASGVTAAFGRPGAEAPLTGSRGACAETSGVLAPWIWTAGISPLLREAGRSDPPVARHCGSGDVPAVRRSEVETSDRAGEVRPRTHCGLPALRPGLAGARPHWFSPRSHTAVGRARTTNRKIFSIPEWNSLLSFRPLTIGARPPTA